MVTTAGLYDVAEDYKTVDVVENGMIVVPDTDRTGYVVKSNGSYVANMLGVVSENPGFLLSQGDRTNQVPVALVGRVKTKVSVENGVISPGDLITTSSVPGIGMKATEAGQVLGIALETLIEDVGSILVFVNPHWNGGSLSDSGTVDFDVLVGGSSVASGSSNELNEGIIFDLSILFENIIKKFAELLDIFFSKDSIKTEKVKVEELCIDDTCITEKQLRELMKSSGLELPTPTPTPEPTPSVTPILTPDNPASSSQNFNPTPTSSPTPKISPTPAPIIEPSPTPTPEPTPSVTPIPTPKSTPTPEPTIEPTPKVTPEPTTEPI